MGNWLAPLSEHGPEDVAPARRTPKLELGRMRRTARLRCNLEELARALPRNVVTKKVSGQGISGDERNVVEYPIGHSAPAKDGVSLRKSDAALHPATSRQR
jgi:hypothetical protein